MTAELHTTSPSVSLDGDDEAVTLEVRSNDVTLEVAQSGPQGPPGTGGGGSERVEYVVVVVPSPVATAIGGSIAGNTLTAAALSAVPVGEDILLTGQTSSADDGIWTHSGGGSFARGDGLATWLAANQADLVVTVTDIGLGKSRVYQVVYNASTDTRSLEPVAADVSSLQSSLTTLTNRLNRYYPSTPVVPHLHVSKYVTFDPDFPLDGSATHVGGQVIDNGQNITVMSNDSGNGGVWTLSLTGPATRATGFGAMVSADIGNYDHVSFTGTRWAYFQLFRLIGDATTLGMAPVPPATGIIGGRGVSKSYKADLIANSVAGDVFTVLEDDNSTTTVDASVDLTGLGVLCILVLSDLTLRTIDNTGAVVAVEDFTRAEGRWTASGVNGDGVGTTVAITDAGSHSVLTGVTPHAASHQDGGSDELALDGSQITTGTVGFARLPTGTTSSTVAVGNDSRFTDSRSPSGTAGGDLTGTYPNPTVASGAITSAKIADGTIVDGDISASAAIAQSKVSGLTTDLAGKLSSTDPSVTNARTPTAHKASHSTGGTDALAPSDIGAVPTTRTVAGKALSADVTLTASDVGAVPTTRTVAGKALSADVTLTASDVGAAATSHTHSGADITSGTVGVARLGSGTPSASNFLRGDGTWATPSGSGDVVGPASSVDNRVALFDGTTGKLLKQSSAALATIATSGSASDLSTGTVASARLNTKVVGGQDEGAAVNEPAVATSLLDSTITLPAFAAGDLLLVNAGFTFLQNSGGARTITFDMRLGSTTILSVALSVTNSATTRSGQLVAAFRVEGTSDVNGSMTVHLNNISSPFVAHGVATENIGSGSLALDFRITGTNNATQTYTLQYLTATRVAA